LHGAGGFKCARLLDDGEGIDFAAVGDVSGAGGKNAIFASAGALSTVN
jgi:hypothetical protein